jgi:hypothetical protein
MNLLASTVTQGLTGAANRASSSAKSFESDLNAGNISGAQSFLSALQQELSTGNTGSAVSAQFAQVGNDLKSGDLTAARTDFSHLKLTISAQAHASAAQASASGNDLARTSTPSNDVLNPQLAAFASYNALQRSAFSGAVDLSSPASIPSFSVNT